MRKVLAASVALLVAAVPAYANGHEGNEGHEGHAGHAAGATKDAHAAFEKLSVAQVAELKKVGKVTVIDANGADTRAKWGIVPGAVLLSSSSKFDASKELPPSKDEKLVFYCA